MSASQIKARLESLHRQYKAGNIGWRNYAQAGEQLFGLLVELTEIVAQMEEAKAKENKADG
jgi:hypothetical protein